MKLLQYLKALVDLAFLYASFGTVFVLFLSANTSVLPLFILAFVLPLAYTMQGRWYRFVAFVPAFLLVFFVQSWVDLLTPAIAFAYLAVSMQKEEYHYTSYLELERVRWQVIALPILMAVFTLGGQGALMSQYTLPLTLLYLVVVNLFLRFLRADPETLASPSFVGAHVLSITLVILAGALLSSEVFIHAVVGAVQFVYYNCIVPVLLAVGIVIFGAIYLVIRLLMLIFGGVSLAESEDTMSYYSGLGEVVEEASSTLKGMPDWLEWAFYFFASSVVLVFVFLVIRNMLSGLREKKANDGITVTKERIAPEASDNRPRMFLTPRQKVRQYYAQFIRLAQQKGIQVKASTDTAQLAQKFGQSEETARLTKYYRHARYDETRAVEKSDAVEAKAALHAIKMKVKTK